MGREYEAYQMRKTFLSVFLLFGSIPAFASNTAEPHVLSCIKEAAARYEHDYLLMVAIAKQESSLRAWIVHKNKPTKKHPIPTEDIGLFQINTDWLPLLAKYGISRESLFEPCVNAHVAAWILWKNKQAYGNTWKAIGAFNSPTIANQQEYIQRVWKRLKGAV